MATDDGRLDVIVNPPMGVGEPAPAPTRSNCSAAGYSACFQGALGVVARERGVDVTGSTVTAKVGIGRNDEGFGLIVEISADIPSVDADTARSLVEQGQPGLPVLQGDPRQHHGHACLNRCPAPGTGR
ncbi:Organic hydroperoxide resistance protein OS=Streptomyces fumanus OX=67302 GN=GCM10018772_01970 PE=3 SV=1 [Streptomyces fumanus]